MGFFSRLFGGGADETRPEQPAAAETPAAPTQQWESWVDRRGDAPAAVALDLALAPAAPDRSRPALARVRYALRSAGPDGLTDGTEGDDLARVEDALEAAFAARGATYAGRITRAGAREHLFYARDEADAAPALDAARADAGPYALLHETSADPDWRAWREALLPPPRTLQWLLDRRVVETLARHGDDPTVPRNVDHLAFFPSAEARAAFVAATEGLGFTPVALREDGPAPTPFAAEVQRGDAVVLEHIHEVAWTLQQLAEGAGGSYDGWGASVERGGPGAPIARA